ncbi:MAG: tyrosine-type recombinase/integrase [Planctomycetota bacterium]
MVRIQGRDHYLGRYRAPESHERYRQLIARYLTTGSVDERKPEESTLTISELAAAFWSDVEHSGRYMKRGKPTSERGWFRESLKPLCRTFGSMPVSEFGPRRLIELRTLMIQEGGRRGPLARSTVNGRIRRMVQLVRWGVSMELVSPETLKRLETVKGLRNGQTVRVRETGGVRAVERALVDATLPFLSPTLAAMVEVQWLGGMRPGEICSMRVQDIDMRQDVWVYRPEDHKTLHHDQECERYLGPKAQAILKEFLEEAQGSFVFSPRRSEVERRRRQRLERKTPLYPSHRARSKAAGESPDFRDSYDVRTYRRAIRRACELAGVERWSPNQLRHARATEVRGMDGLEAAQVLLGHATVDVTQIYAERDRKLGFDVARRSG